MKARISKWGAATRTTFVVALAVATTGGVAWSYAGRIAQRWGDEWLDRTMGGQHLSVLLVDSVTVDQIAAIEHTAAQTAAETPGLELEGVVRLSSDEAARQFGRTTGHSIQGIRLPASVEVSFAGDAAAAARLKERIAMRVGVREVVDDTEALKARGRLEQGVGRASVWAAAALGLAALVLLYGAALGWVLAQVQAGEGAQVVRRAFNLGAGVGAAWAVVVAVGDAAASSIGVPWALGLDGSLWTASWAVVGGAAAAVATAALAKWSID